MSRRGLIAGLLGLGIAAAVNAGVPHRTTHVAKPRNHYSYPTRSEPKAADTSVYYRNCSEARAAGAAPIYRGQPGYRPELDRDGDGVACEPYHRR